MKNHWRRKIPIVMLFVAGAFLGISAIVMLLWNAILPAVFHIGVISYWQAAGILLLGKILFGGIKGRHGFSGGCHGRKKMFGKWMEMSDEEKEMFAQRMGYMTQKTA